MGYTGNRMVDIENSQAGWRVLLLTVLLASVCACGPVSGEPPMFIGLDDQIAFVGEELFFEIRASDAEISQLRFASESVAPGFETASLVPAGNGTSALFRWTPTALDIGEWVVDFKVSDGINDTIESIVIQVRSTQGVAPRFLQPLGAGTTLDVTEAPCLRLTVSVEDTDSSNVVVSQQQPGIEGATLEREGTHWLWQWCPSKDQIGGGDSFTLVLIADDGEHQTLKHFVIVLRNVDVLLPVDVGGFTLNQAGASCQFILPMPLEIGRGTALIIARDAAKAAFETFWGVTLPTTTTYINTADQCPRINGDESFILRDSSGAIVDGPTPILAAHENFQRNSPIETASDRISWTIASDIATNAGPGVIPTAEAGRIFISEFSDANGNGNFVFEFIEITVN